jgi:anthranilate phosphoribosyltransferase
MSSENLVSKVEKKISLNISEAKCLFENIMDGKFDDETLEKILLSLSEKGETVEEITGGALVLRDKCKKINISEDTIDTCGTGGDGKNTVNISTATGIVLASYGLKVAKHGNRGLSSKSGSADVLEKLGYNILKDPKQIEEDITQRNFGFMFAPNFHSAMKNVANVRKKIKKRTIFNLLGPLCNPAKANRQCIGVFAKDILEKYVNVLKNLNLKKAWVYHSFDGLDEISTFDKTKVYELKNNKISSFFIDPKEIVKKPGSVKDILGDDAEYNAKKIVEVFHGKENPLHEIISLNVAAGLIVSDKHNNLLSAYQDAKKYLLSGVVLNFLDNLKI